MNGTFLMCLAMLFGSQRWVLIQVVVQRSPPTSALGQMSKLEYTARILPVAGAICFILALIFEQPFLTREHMQPPILLAALPAIGASVTVLTLTELAVVRRTSAVAMQVLATLHNIPIVVVSAAVFHEHVSA